MQTEIIWNLIAKKLAGEASPEELINLEDLLKANPELHYPTQTIIDFWDTNHDQNKEETWILLHSGLNTQERRRK